MQGSTSIQFLSLVKNIGIINISRNLFYRFSKINRFSKLRRIQHKTKFSSFFYDLENFEDDIALYNNAWEEKQTYFSWHKKNTSNIPEWNKLCFSGELFGDINKDWHKIIINKSDKDIKEVWEASRMDWLITFSQKTYLGDLNYLDKLNEWLGDWIKNNPPYKGPNWTCAQEASIRVINFTIAARILNKQFTLSSSSINFIEMHLKRILPAINYSLSQQNNHATTEAAALFIGGLYLRKSNSKNAEKYIKKGRRVLEERVKYLISDQGIFSQYSTNYQRMLLDTLSISEYTRRLFQEQKFSKTFYKKAISSLNWLSLLVDKKSGAVPNLGANDGTMLIPLIGNNFYEDFRISTELASQIFLNKTTHKNDLSIRSFLSWLKLQPSDQSRMPPEDQNFLSDGFFIRRSKSSLVLVRYPDYKFRPVQEDNLHIDLWVEGINILRDAGTFSYLSTKDNDYFSSTLGHNTVSIDNLNQMPKFGKFLYGHWPKVHKLELDYISQDKYNFSVSYKDYNNNLHDRKIEIGDRSLHIRDTVIGNFGIGKLIWRLAPGEWILNGNTISKENIKISLESHNISKMKILKGWESRFYGLKGELPYLEVSFQGNDPIKTLVSW